MNRIKPDILNLVKFKEIHIDAVRENPRLAAYSDSLFIVSEKLGVTVKIIAPDGNWFRTWRSYVEVISEGR